MSRSAGTPPKRGKRFWTTRRGPAAIAAWLLLLFWSLSGAVAAPGEGIFKARCGQCHQLPDPGKAPAEGWAKRLEMMAPLAGLSAKEKGEVLEFLQTHTQKAAKFVSMAEERRVFEQKCGLCHAPDRVFLEPLTPEAQRHIVLRMRERAPDWFTDEDIHEILEYLARGAPEAKKPVRKEVKGGAAEVFRERCSACHTLERIYLRVEEGRDKAPAWIHTVKRMREKAPTWISDEEVEQIVQYLRTLKPVAEKR